MKQISISKYTDANNFIREVEVLVHTRHPNVVPFVGAVLEPPKTCWLVFEYMSGSTLTTWLYGAKGKARPRRTMVERMQKALEVLWWLWGCAGKLLPTDYVFALYFVG